MTILCFILIMPLPSANAQDMQLIQAKKECTTKAIKNLMESDTGKKIIQEIRQQGITSCRNSIDGTMNYEGLAVIQAVSMNIALKPLIVSCVNKNSNQIDAEIQAVSYHIQSKLFAEVCSKLL